MFAGPEEGDHFTLNIYDKVTPNQILKYWGFLQNFFFPDICQAVLHVLAPKSRIWFLVFVEIRWVKGEKFTEYLI